jgi:transcriptional regulator with XRE-family HTH domain
MKTLQSDFGQYLRKLRKNNGQTLHQVSKVADIDSPLICKIERGERFPTAEQIKKLSMHYKIPESELIIKVTAEKIIKDYGVNEITYDAVNLVKDQLTSYLKK